MTLKSIVRAAAVLLFVLVSGPSFASEPPNPELLQSVSVKDAKDLLAEGGAKVKKTDFNQDSFTITAELGPERHVWFEGMDCQGAGEAMSCPEFKISAHWQLDTPVRAAELAKQLSYNYTSIFADGDNLFLWRMDFTYGGITREHLRRTVFELLDLRQQAEDVIWPPTGGSKSKTPASK